MLKAIALAGVAALTLSACAGTDTGDSMSSGSASAGVGGSAMASDAGAALPAMEYMTAAGQSDAFETQSSQVALAQAKNSRVRDFATMMIRDHGKTTATLMAAAQKSGMTPPPAPPPLRPDQQQMVSQLQSAGPATDATYMQQQVMAHQEALTLHSSYAKSGGDPNLKAAAATAVPIVQAHLDMAQSIAGAVR